MKNMLYMLSYIQPFLKYKLLSCVKTVLKYVLLELKPPLYALHKVKNNMKCRVYKCFQCNWFDCSFKYKEITKSNCTYIIMLRFNAEQMIMLLY